MIASDISGRLSGLLGHGFHMGSSLNHGPFCGPTFCTAPSKEGPPKGP